MTKRVKQMEEGAGTALGLEDFVLLCVCYRHGNFGGIRVEARQEVIPGARVGIAEA